MPPFPRIFLFNPKCPSFCCPIGTPPLILAAVPFSSQVSLTSQNAAVFSRACGAFLVGKVLPRRIRSPTPPPFRRPDLVLFFRLPGFHFLQVDFLVQLSGFSHYLFHPPLSVKKNPFLQTASRRQALILSRFSSALPSCDEHKRRLPPPAI